MFVTCVPLFAASKQTHTPLLALLSVTQKSTAGAQELLLHGVKSKMCNVRTYH